ncbi:MAG: hypothetical protein P1U85_02825 [Verrucomicrobiales bacterium]|nr:hypothetical protein [Verrucomicrobiales bacterium]
MSLEQIIFLIGFSFRHVFFPRIIKSPRLGPGICIITAIICFANVGWRTWNTWNDWNDWA